MRVKQVSCILSLFILHCFVSNAQIDSLRSSIQKLMPGVDLGKSMMEIRQEILNDTAFRASDTDRCNFTAEYLHYDMIPGSFDQRIFFETKDDSDWVCHLQCIFLGMNFSTYDDASKCRDSLCRIFEKYYSWHKLKEPKQPVLGNSEDYEFAMDKKAPVVAELSLFSPFDLFPYWGICITWMKKE